MLKKLLLFLTVILFVSKVSFPQLDNYLGQINSKDVENYVKPLATSFGTAINSGIYHTAQISKTFSFSVGFKGMLVLIPESDKTFTPASLPSGYDASTPTATVFGDKGTAYAGNQGFYAYPGGFNINSVPLAIPQVGIDIIGVNLIARYVGGFKLGDRDISLVGAGLRYSISQFLPLFPLDIAVHGFYNNMSVKDVFSSSNLAFGACASKTFGPLTAYGGLQYEQTDVNFKYKVRLQGGTVLTEIESNVKGKNSFRFTAGAALKLLIFTLNADANFGSQTALSSGLTFTF